MAYFRTAGIFCGKLGQQIMIEAFIFDMDGVITDTVVYHCRSWQIIADREGWQFDEKVNEKLLGLTRRDSLLKIMEHNNLTLNEKQIEAVCREKNDYFADMIDDMTEADLLPGVKDLITGLKNSGYKLAVASASRNAPLVLKSIGIYDLFDIVCDGSSVKNGKPAPDIFMLAAGKLGVNPECCVVFEDALAGVQAAHAAGMRVIGVGDTDLLAEADYVFKSSVDIVIAELLKTLDETKKEMIND